MIDVIIPTLNAAETLPATLISLSQARQTGLISKIIICDAGSQDETPSLSQAAKCLCVTSPKGRGVQLHQGAMAASSPWLLFLHADTCLMTGWDNEVAVFIKNHNKKAGYFRFGLDDQSAKARFVEKLVFLRNRLFALPYGDQGLLISRPLYDDVHGYEPVPLMEDVLMTRKLGRSRLHAFKSKAITSAIRYRRDGYARQILKNAFCLTLFFIGVSPERIAKIYG